MLGDKLTLSPVVRDSYPTFVKSDRPDIVAVSKNSAAEDLKDRDIRESLNALGRILETLNHNMERLTIAINNLNRSSHA